MRILLLTLIIIIQGVSLFASDTAMSADDRGARFLCQEVTASWESESDAAIFSDRVLSDFRHITDSGFTVNLLCSYDTIVKLSALRKLAASVILFGISGGATVAVPLSGRILSKVGHISVTPLIASEIELVHRSAEFNGPTVYTPCAGFSEEKRVPEVSSFTAVNSITAQSNLKLRVSHARKTFNAYCDAPQCQNSLFDGEFADMYRLFLYVKDSSGNGSAESFTYHCFNPASKVFSFNLLKHQITSNKPNQIPQTGVHL